MALGSEERLLRLFEAAVDGDAEAEERASRILSDAENRARSAERSARDAEERVVEAERRAESVIVCQRTGKTWLETILEKARMGYEIEIREVVDRYVALRERCEAAEARAAAAEIRAVEATDRRTSAIEMFGAFGAAQDRTKAANARSRAAKRRETAARMDELRALNCC
jgi:23S rRNA pseudoU1915 N3-methylase RlmH